MGTYNSAVITNGGQSMIAQAVAGASLEFTTIKTSNYAYPAGTNLATLTTINGIRQSKDITSATVYNSRVIKISATVDNTGISTAYTINTIGIYAKVGSSAESLFAVVTASAADTMPAYDSKPYSYIYEINLTMQNAANVTVTVNTAGLVNVADLNAAKVEIQGDLNAAKVEIQGEIADLKNFLDEDESLLFDENTSTETLVVNPTFSSGYCLPTGETTEHENYQYTNIIPVQPGDVIHGVATTNPGSASEPTNPCYVRYWCAYNGNTAIEASGDRTGTVRTYTVPNGINGIRMTMNLALYTAGTLVVKIQRQVTTKTLKPELLTVIEQTVEKDSEDAVSGNAVYDFVITERLGKNLIDKTNAVTGAVQSNGSIATNGSWANYKTSDYIPVTAGQSYKLYLANQNGQSSSTTRLIYCLFKSDKTAASYTNESGVGYLTITPVYDGFIRVTCENATSSYFANNLMLILGTTAVPYENYDLQLLLNNNINPNNDKSIGNILRGKKWCPCGDSFTAYTNASFTSGKYAGKNKTYPYLIALRNDMEILSAFFMSGRTMAYPADHTFTNSLTCPTNAGYYQNIPADADIITIMLGINDCQHTGSGTTGDGEDATGVITLGTIDDNTTATYYGAWNVVLGWLRENRPFAHVGIIVTNGITANGDWKAAQIAIAKKWGYPLLDLNGDEKTPAMIRCYNPNVSDAVKEILRQKQAVDYDGSITGSVNTHPNWQAHEYESTFIEAWLKSL